MQDLDSGFEAARPDIEAARPEEFLPSSNDMDRLEINEVTRSEPQTSADRVVVVMRRTELYLVNPSGPRPDQEMHDAMVMVMP